MAESRKNGRTTGESANDEKFGAVKLNKLLFYSDFISFVKRGRAITDQVYFALREGPAPRRLLPIRKEMENAREIEIVSVDRFGFPQHRIIAKRLARLGPEDAAIARTVVQTLAPMSGKDVTDLSHKFAGWKAAFSEGEGTEIPYQSVGFDLEGFFGGVFPFDPPSAISKELKQKLMES